MTQVDDLALVPCPQINAEVVAIHDRDHAKLLMPHNIIRVVRVGKGLLATKPAPLMLRQGLKHNEKPPQNNPRNCSGRRKSRGSCQRKSTLREHSKKKRLSAGGRPIPRSVSIRGMSERLAGPPTVSPHILLWRIPAERAASSVVYPPTRSTASSVAFQVATTLSQSCIGETPGCIRPGVSCR